ncbi:MAG: metallophosphoesterase [Planctomycetaceae bacterium]|nr:metallophosphoesterase [Planctomycetaceae bacterium]
MLNRREFLIAGSAALGAAAAGSAFGQAAAGDDAFEFALFGDTHFDKLAHHDFDWLRREHPDSVRQVEHYSEHAASLLPELFATVKRQLTSAGARARAVVHVGDFVEGLCGTPALAETHVREACEAIERIEWKVPFLMTKGNHDKTGPGADDAYAKLLHPFLGGQVGQKLTSARYAHQIGGALFAFYDAYDKSSFDWLKETLGRNGRADRQTFVVVHPPVVPFQARGNWSLYMREEDAARRAELLALLGEHRAIVLCGHVHRFGFVVRRTERGPFAQLCLSSIMSAREQQPKQVLAGLDAYVPELTKLEPKFQPESVELRRKQFATEKPHIAHFEYAETAGHAMVRVDGRRVTVRIFNGTGDAAWKEIDVTQLLQAA